MPSLRVVRRLCPAKINLALSVGPPQGPRSYHPIASWMVGVQWGDDLLLEAAEESASSIDIAFAPDAPTPQHVDWPLEQDLAWRAHALLQRHVGRALPVHMALRKRIPTGAGLGGGSSDAAGVLLALTELYNLALSPHQLAALGASLGSDVPFCIMAGTSHPAAIATGFGERLEPLPLTEAMHLVIFLPDARCPTRDVYQALDAGDATTLDEQRVRRLAENPRAYAAFFNDLFAPALRVAPSLRAAHACLMQRLQRPVHLTGSGAAMFTVADSAADAQRISDAATRLCDMPAVVTTTLKGE